MPKLHAYLAQGKCWISEVGDHGLETVLAPQARVEQMKAAQPTRSAHPALGDLVTITLLLDDGTEVSINAADYDELIRHQ